MNIKNGILNMLKHGNKHDLIHFITNHIYISFKISVITSLAARPAKRKKKKKEKMD